MSAARRHDVAIYAPHAFVYYRDERAGGGNRRRGGGGAELQTFLIATALAQAGLRVAHIVFKVTNPVPGGAGRPAIVERPDQPTRRPWFALAEARHVWRAMAGADAGVYVFRGGGKHLAVGAMFCFLHRRKLVLSGSSDLDFDVPRRIHTRIGRVLYPIALRRCARVVVQTRQQGEIARGVLGDDARISRIPNFAEPADSDDGPSEVTGFLWAGRIADYKLPLEYLDLAKALPDATFRMVAARSPDDGADELAARIAAGAAEVPNLELLPAQPRADVLELISESAAVVNTSNVEGMPNLFLEAWARGVPALSLHVDPDATIAERGLGFAAGGSWDAFVEGARRLWEDPALRAELGATARRYVDEMHSPGAVQARWVAVLGDVLGDPEVAPSA